MPPRTPRPLDSAGLWQYALRILGARTYSIGELRDKLERRAESAGDVAGILARLKECGYLDDRRFAEAFSAARLENEGFGKARVLRDLRKRRVAPAVAQRAVEQTYQETDESRLIEDFLRRKYRNVALEKWLETPKNLAAAYRRLRLAGFSAPHVARALKRFAKEPEWLDACQEEDSPEPGLS